MRRALAASLLACAALATLLAPPAQAQTTATHEVHRGDTLFGIARSTAHDGVTRNQMILAIWRANQGAFPGGNINLLEIGTVLAIPSRDAAAAVAPAEADRLVRELLAKAAGAQVQVAAVKPPEAMASPPKAKVAPLMSPEAAARRYREGLALEGKGDDQGALRAFLDSGEAGYGLAQRKLGQIYDTGNLAVQRDYQASLRWYQKAREQGVEIDKPLPRMTTK